MLTKTACLPALWLQENSCNVCNNKIEQEIGCIPVLKRTPKLRQTAGQKFSGKRYACRFFCSGLFSRPFVPLGCRRSPREFRKNITRGLGQTYSIVLCPILQAAVPVCCRAPKLCPAPGDKGLSSHSLAITPPNYKAAPNVQKGKIAAP